MEKMISKRKCTGCTACANICPKKAIELVISDDGFKYPVIDHNKCINCGLCKKTCPVLNTVSNNSKDLCFAGYAKDVDLLKKSSSGGLFSVIAEWFLENNGIVIGAAFNNVNKLEHIAITKMNDMDKLRGSKYLQSDLNSIFSYIKDNLKNNKILFIGTPCQVAGIKAYIKNDYSNLYCIDIVCHGVPSPKLFDKYVMELENRYNEKLKKYVFRDKSTGWENYSNTAYLDRKKISELHLKNNYMRLFLSNVCLRESCFNCNFKLGNKYSDITLGDFWGVENFYPEIYNKNGVSAIIINTEKGINLLKEIENKIVYKECKIENIIKYNPSLIKSCNINNKRNDFFDELESLNIKALTIKYAKPNTNIFKRIIRKIVKIFKN